MATEEAAGAAGHARRSQPPDGLLKRILPTTALGLAGVLFLMSIASAFTGAVLYAFYEYRLGKTEDRVDAFEAGFEDSVNEAISRIDAERDTAVGAVQSQLDDLEKFAASGETLSSLLEKAAPSVWFVETLDEAGQPSVGSAFVVFADGEQSFLLTSYNTVRAGTQEPSPGITIRKGDEKLEVELTSWDPANDLALLTVDRPSLPALEWAPTDPPLQIGDRVFVVSGLGAAGGSISQGFVADVSGNGIQHDSPVGAAFQGGPLLNSKGEVLAVASRAYSPLGFAPEAVFFGVPIRTSCNEVIRCPSPDTQPG
ncbi:MAG: trypsin-like peptidase domain-containing protein [Actinomycetota bacterium]